MSFAKGVMIGTLISAGVTLYYTEMNKSGAKKLMKQGKKWLKNMGM